MYSFKAHLGGVQSLRIFLNHPTGNGDILHIFFNLECGVYIFLKALSLRSESMYFSRYLAYQTLKVQYVYFLRYYC